MKRRVEGFDSRLDESLGERHEGPNSQSMKDRRDESKGEEKKSSGHAFEGDKSMDKSYKHHMAQSHHKYMANHHRKKLNSK